MKYYAVTDDPNELLHYGVKGMKWGEHLFGTDGRRSPGYKRALGKLRSSVQKATSAIKKNNFQRQMDKQKKQQEKYNNAVKNIQRRIKIAEGLNRTNNIRSLEKSMAREMRIQQKRAKIAAKREAIAQRNELAADKTDLKYFKNEAKMNKFIQKARKGTLKYGKLSDDQVRQITDRLTMEQNARRLGSAEKTWRQQKKEAFRKGKLSGIERGTAAAMEEVARAGAVYGIQNFMNRRKLNAAAKQKGKQERIKRHEENNKTRKEMREDLRDEAYANAIKAGLGPLQRRQRLTIKGVSEMNRLAEAKKLESSDLQKRWQEYLTENGLTSKEAVKGYKQRFTNEEAVRRKILAQDAAKKVGEAKVKKQTEEILDKAAFDKLNAKAKLEEKHQQNIAAQEKANANLKEKYEKDLEAYNKDKESNAKLKSKYDQEMQKYNKDLSDYNIQMDQWKKASDLEKRFGPGSIKVPNKPNPPVKPTAPTYKNISEPPKPKYKKIDYDYHGPQIHIDSYDEYMRMKNMGYDPLGLGSGNNGGKKKKKNS